MRADLYLSSITEPFFDSYTMPKPEPGRLREQLESIYDDMRSSGGYFRNGYNTGDVMWAMGLSWPGTLGPMLDDECRLPIACAQELLAMVEARPLTREILARQFLEQMTDGEDKHPITGPIASLMGSALPPDFEQLSAFLIERREELISILKKSIELDEPLFCSI